MIVTAGRGDPPRPCCAPAGTFATSPKWLGEVVLEPAADGLPAFGSPGRKVTCEVCGRDVPASDDRTVEVTRPYPRKATVCSVTCARAASAGETD